MSHPHHSKKAARALRSYLAAQQEAILAGDAALREGDDEAIHKTRVATRRLRSALRVFGALFEPDRAEALDQELRWYAGLLGGVRDSQVMKKLLSERLASLPKELVQGRVEQRIDSHLDAQRAAGGAKLRAELDRPRYLALLADIADFAEAPPLDHATDVSGSVMVRLADEAAGKVRKRLRKANATADVELLHRARKSAKRARYGAEAIRPFSGRAAEREARRYEELQDLLGDHQDSIVAAQLLLRLGAAADSTDESGFTYGVLFEREQERAAEARRRAREAAQRYR